MKILMVLTSHDQLGNTGLKTGFWLEEFAAPYFVFKDAGVELTLASPNGRTTSARSQKRQTPKPNPSDGSVQERRDSEKRARQHGQACRRGVVEASTRYFIPAATGRCGSRGEGRIRSLCWSLFIIPASRSLWYAIRPGYSASVMYQGEPLVKKESKSHRIYERRGARDATHQSCPIPRRG